jgi:cation-transporting ATPase E
MSNKKSSESTHLKIQSILTIIARNTFLLINGIIFAVVALLIIFGSTREGIFLGVITVWNMIVGIAQEIRSWLALEKLQFQTALKVIKIASDGTESVVLAEDIAVGDTIKLKVGDQIPCDGRLKTARGFEVNEALMTGESASVERKEGEEVFAGGIVTSGLGVMIAEKVFTESKIAEMTKTIKKYSPSISPIQRSLNSIIKYTGYVLLVIILFVVSRGYLIDESTVKIVQSVGALTSALLPQGMVVIITLLFSYGAAHLYNRNVLVQEINAVEKVGRIRNLCIDKTGTLTDNNLSLECVYEAPGITKEMSEFAVLAYLAGTGDSSQTMMVIRGKINDQDVGEILDNVAFSSSRQFGAVHVKKDSTEHIILAGAPDVFLPYCKSESEKTWLKKLIDQEAKTGKRLVCFAKSNSKTVPKNLERDLRDSGLSITSLYVINNNLRDGIVEAINFFQSRGVAIRVISGDSPDTVRAVAMAAGIKNTDKFVTGTDLDSWSDDDFLAKISENTIFARIKPHQKEKIITALKTSGFTAMIGDGANDALAIKKADLGIAMFDGAQATRQVASIILTKNNFNDLPNGVILSENIIENIEICASIFFNQTFIGFFLFIALTSFGFSFPLTPLNVTFINYFTVGFPGFLIFYWIIRPVHAHVFRVKKDFLRRVIPFALVSAVFQSIVAIVAFFVGVKYIGLANLGEQSPTGIIAFTFIILGMIFLIFTPGVYSGVTTEIQKKQFVLLTVIEGIAMFVLLKIPFIIDFFNLNLPTVHSFLTLLPIFAVYFLVQWFITVKFFRTKYEDLHEIKKV